MPVTLSNKPIPQGIWLTLRRLQPNATDEQVCEFLRDKCGIDLPLDNVRVSRGDFSAWATISLSKRHILDLVERAMMEAGELNGRKLQVAIPEKHPRVTTSHSPEILNPAG